MRKCDRDNATKNENDRNKGTKSYAYKGSKKKKERGDWPNNVLGNKKKREKGKEKRYAADEEKMSNDWNVFDKRKKTNDYAWNKNGKKKKEEEERRYREEERRLQKEEEERKRREKEHEERLKSEKIRQEREKGEEKARLAREREELERLEFEHLEASVRRQKEIDEEKEHRKEMRRLKKESDKEIKLELERELSFSFRDDEGGLPIDDEFRSQRRASFDQSWSEAVSPAPNGTKKKVDVGHVPKGIVAKLVNGQGKAPKSPTTLYSPRVQEELNKSIGKGLVAQRLSTAKAKEKLGGSIPSMFSSFDL